MFLFSGVFSARADRASDLVEAGVALANDAEFERALATFDEALASDDMDLEALVRLLAHRAVVAFALRRSGDLERDLAWLAVLDPDHRFPPTVPPGVRDRFDAIRATSESTRVRARVLGAVSLADGGIRVDADVIGVPDALVRVVRVFARVVEGEWTLAEGARVTLRLPAGAPLEWYVELVGPGGAVLTSDGSRLAPHRFEQPPYVRPALVLTAPVPGVALVPDAPSPRVAPSPTSVEVEGTDRSPRARRIVIGSGVLVVLGALAFVATRIVHEPSTRVDAPVAP